ncbi:MAG TPA: serine/threonine-protein kinase [Terracidiphilus sp.]|nr:serine/threonine-protein kinase [Terracidiphilus sp.]
MAFEPGQKIGDYEIVSRLGAGGLGVVYEVTHTISRRREAMKILLPDQSAAPEMVERFHREVQTLAALNHVNIAALHTAFYHENQLAMVMELIHGETLRDKQQRSAIPLNGALEYVAQTLRALAYAHRLGVVHRDIKPSNIMITADGIVKLLDFGIALKGHSTGLTRAGYLLGSLNYMSPEQVNGGKATARSDIYSVGVMLYELLTGKLPITGATTYEIMLGHMNQIPAPPHEVAPEIPTELSSAVMRALEKDPERRFPTADEFLYSLQVPPGALDQTMAPSPSIRTRATALTTPIAAAEPASSPLPSGEPKQSSGSGFESLPLEDLRRKLAIYIGPVAKFVVKKLAAQHSDIDVLYREAAKQIPSDADRAAFLKSKGRSPAQ